MAAACLRGDSEKLWLVALFAITLLVSALAFIRNEEERLLE
jgi:hypothetical protein